MDSKVPFKPKHLHELELFILVAEPIIRRIRISHYATHFRCQIPSKIPNAHSFTINH